MTNDKHIFDKALLWASGGGGFFVIDQLLPGNNIITNTTNNEYRTVSDRRYFYGTKQPILPQQKILIGHHWPTDILDDVIVKDMIVIKPGFITEFLLFIKRMLAYPDTIPNTTWLIRMVNRIENKKVFEDWNNFGHGVETQAFHALEAVPNMPLLLKYREEYNLNVHSAFVGRNNIFGTTNRWYHRNRNHVYGDFDSVLDKKDLVRKDLINSCFSFTTDELLTIYDYTWFMNTFNNTKLRTDIKKPSDEILKFFNNLDKMPFWKARVEEHRAHWRESMIDGKIRSAGAIRYWFHTMFRADELMHVAENFEQAQDELGVKLYPFKKSLRVYDYEYSVAA